MSITKPALITLRHVSFRYATEQVLDDISLEVHQGDFVGLIGPNGSGKTTLLRIILGLLTPQIGEVLLSGARIGYVPQKVSQADNQFPVTVEEVVRQGRINRVGLGRWLARKDIKAVDQALASVGMQATKKRLLRELSGGQQQRIHIARALAGEPELLLLDEPTVGVDIESQDEFYELLATLRKEKKLTLVMVSHDVDVVMNEVNKLACINKHLIFHGSPERFLKGDYLEKLYGKGRSLILHGH